jgi:hypothetical protein
MAPTRKMILTNSSKEVGLSAADVSGREKLMHTMLLKTGQRVLRVQVARRAIFATRKSLDSQLAQKVKSPFSNPRARTPKLYPHSHPTGVENYSYLIREVPALFNSP